MNLTMPKDTRNLNIQPSRNPKRRNPDIKAPLATQKSPKSRYGSKIDFEDHFQTPHNNGALGIKTRRKALSSTIYKFGFWIEM